VVAEPAGAAAATARHCDHRSLGQGVRASRGSDARATQFGMHGEELAAAEAATTPCNPSGHHTGNCGAEQERARATAREVADLLDQVTRLSLPQRS
jgi:hypothetical protein